MQYNFPPNFAGLLERVNFVRTFELINKLHPNAAHIYVVNDTTTTGRILKQQLLLASISKELIQKVVFISDLSFYDLKSQISKIISPDVVLFLLYNRDSQGKYYDFEDVLDTISRHAIAPKFPLDFSGKGIDLGIDIKRRLDSGVRVAIIREKGVNGDREMAWSLYMAGFDVKDVHMASFNTRAVSFVVLIANVIDFDSTSSCIEPPPFQKICWIQIGD